MNKALIWGESLVGSGHARVQSELARHLCARGWEVTVITGSQAQTDHFDFATARMVYQPPVRLEHPGRDPYNMAHLITPNGVSVLADQAFRRERRQRLLELYHACKPTVVVTEMWPYARANFDFELVPLATAVQADTGGYLGGFGGPRLYSIARDIMFPPHLSSPDSPGLDSNRHALAAEFFGPRSILVRGDPSVIPLETSVGDLPEEVRGRIDYVGYFVAPAPARPPTGAATRREVVVCSGGGMTRDSLILFRKAIEGRKHARMRGHVWRVLVPHACPEPTFHALQALAAAEAADGGIVVERYRRDFLAVLGQAALVICHAGNTIVEAVQSCIPALVVPRCLAKNNDEQQIRAHAFHRKGLISMATLAEIEDARVLAAKADACAMAVPASCPILVDGAARMAHRITADTCLVAA